MYRSRSAGELCRMSEDGDEWGDTTSRKQSTVSFVVHEAPSKDNIAEKDHDEASMWSSLLSVIYALILIVIGFLATLMEIVHGTWLKSMFLSIFLAYLYGVSSIFLIIVQVQLYLRRSQQRRKAAEEKQKKTSCTQEERQTTKSVYNVPLQEIPENSMVLNVRNYQYFDTSGTPSGSIHSLQNEQETAMNNDDGSLRSFGSSLPIRTNTTRKRSVATLLHSNGETVSMDLNLEDLEDDEEFEENVILLNMTATQGHEGASFYLRLGSLVFGAGNFVFVCLEIKTYQEFGSCGVTVHYFPGYLILIFQLIQTFVLFKGMNMHIKTRRWFYRFGFMHVLATNLVVWLRVLIRETSNTFKHIAANDTVDDSYHGNCSKSESLILQASPYLFPFVLEYSLIAAAVMAGMHQALNIRVNINLMQSLKREVLKLKEGRTQNQDVDEPEAFFARAHVGMFLGAIAVTGTIIVMIFFFLYLEDDDKIQGYLVYSMCSVIIDVCQIFAVSIALFKFRKLSYTFNRSNTIDATMLMISLSGVLLIQIFIAMDTINRITSSYYYETKNDQTNQFLGNSRYLSDINNSPPLAKNKATDSSSVFVIPIEMKLTQTLDTTSSDGAYTEFSPSMNILWLVDCSLTIILSILQTCFILDGLQRYTNDSDQRREKPARGLVTFLIITNIGMWLYSSFLDNKVLETNSAMKSHPVWPILVNIGLPLSLFFRFHSSVCLADIWSRAYVWEEESHYKNF